MGLYFEVSIFSRGFLPVLPPGLQQMFGCIEFHFSTCFTRCNTSTVLVHTLTIRFVFFLLLLLGQTVVEAVHHKKYNMSHIELCNTFEEILSGTKRDNEIWITQMYVSKYYEALL